MLRLLVGMLWQKLFMLVYLIGIHVVIAKSTNVFFFFIMHCWVTILFIVATLTGSLIRSIDLSDKMSIPRCKLEFWIFMVLSALRIIGKPVSVILGRKLVSVTCHWKYFLFSFILFAIL